MYVYTTIMVPGNTLFFIPLGIPQNFEQLTRNNVFQFFNKFVHLKYKYVDTQIPGKDQFSTEARWHIGMTSASYTHSVGDGGSNSGKGESNL